MMCQDCGSIACRLRKKVGPQVRLYHFSLIVCLANEDALDDTLDNRKTLKDYDARMLHRTDQGIHVCWRSVALCVFGTCKEFFKMQ